MNKNGKKLIWKLKASLALVAVLGTTLLSNVTTVYAEEIMHTHIWATKYDSSKHWEYCTVCKKTQNSKNHSFTDHWFLGTESCRDRNHSTKICECGYSYKYNKPHGQISNWKYITQRQLHYNYCMEKDCGNWIKSERCTDAQGTLGCKNPGKCTVCGNTLTEKNHYIVGSTGKCRDCGKVFVEKSNFNIQYASDYSSATVTFRLTPKLSGLELTGNMQSYTSTINYKKAEFTSTKNSDGSVDYKVVYTFNPETQRKCHIYMGSRIDFAKYEGTNLYISSGIYEFDIWQDHTNPEVTDVQQKDQTLYNTWATIKELTIKGKENLSDYVAISILDAQTGDVIVNKAKTDVKNGNYTYKCTPPLEGPEAGRKYKVIVEDQIGNTTSKDFMIYKTDCRAPLVRSSKEFTEWSKTKNIQLELTDYGAGAPATSLNNQTSYKNATKSGDKYIANYTFATENYDVTEYKMYVKDGLGNASLEMIKVGKVDNTKPTVTDVKFDFNYEVAATVVGQPAPSSNPIGTIVLVTANDMNTTLNREGSGVAGYAITKSMDEPKDTEWKKEKALSINEAGKFYLWVKDTAGNLADVKVINVKEDFTAELGEDIPVQGDKPVIEDPKPEQPKPEQPKPEKPIDGGDKKDDTPSTGDNTIIYLALTLLGLSTAGMTIAKKSKKRRMY